MYHRFDENKYPSTNIKMDVFKDHIEIIKKNNFSFFDPKNLDNQFEKIVQEYRKYGFRDAKVVEDTLWFSDDRKRMYLKIKIRAWGIKIY